MTYQVYIRKDYKPVIRETRDTPIFRSRSINRILVAGLCVTAVLILGMRSHDFPVPEISVSAYTPTPRSLFATPEKNIAAIEPALTSMTPPAEEDIIYSPVLPEDPFPAEEFSVEESTVLSGQEMADTVIPDQWESLKVAAGDNLSLIFDRLQIKPAVLHEIMSLGNDVAILKRLMPNHEMRLRLEDGDLEGLQYDVSLTDTLHITKQGGQFIAETITTALETRTSEASGIITHSLFLDAQRAGLSDPLIMQLVELYGWDIDFALDIRAGDRFYVIYEEKFKDGVKVQDGPILAAQFVNQDKPFRAVRYIHADGHTDYYNEHGFSMRKAFLRTPVNFSRISSKFSLGRKHPILNKIRAHRGVDYAAPTGTPVKATGDSIVTLAGNKGGYGRTVILRHGEKYSTLYGHLSRYARGIRNGTRVKQGQIIGYVGSSGLATGPHLHYEFRINGVHHNPLTVELPKALSIPKAIMADFRTQTLPILAQLDHVVKTASANISDAKPVVALIENTDTSARSTE